MRSAKKGIEYYREKPEDDTRRFYYLPNACEIAGPDGDDLLVDGPGPERDQYAEGAHDEDEYYVSLGEWIPKKDCANGIYVPEEVLDKLWAEEDEEE